MDDSSTDPDERLAPHFEYFSDRSNLIFSYYFCTFEFWEDRDFACDPSDSDRAWSLKTIQNACLNMSLISLRDLDDFFTPRDNQTREDDLRASDFGYSSSLRFLSRDERCSVNKMIAHTTELGVLNAGEEWDIWELISKAGAQVLTFAEWIQKEYFQSFNLWTAAINLQNKTKGFMGWIQRRIDEEQPKGK